MSWPSWCFMLHRNDASVCNDDTGIGLTQEGVLYIYEEKDGVFSFFE